MIIVTVTYKGIGDNPDHVKDFVFENVPSPNTVRWFNDKMDSGRITRVVVMNGERILWDTDRDEDWF